MKGLTLWQPWASLIALGVKPHETRGHRTHYRGPILIHASKRWTAALDRERVSFDYWLNALDPRCPQLPKPLPLGAVVAIAHLQDCYGTITDGMRDIRTRHLSKLDYLFGDWSIGRYAWRLTQVQALPEPIPWPGKQGLWNVPPDLKGRVLAALLAPHNLEQPAPPSVF